MKKKNKKKIKPMIWCAAAVLSLFIVLGVFSVVKALISGEANHKKRRVHMVQLMKPPPPPKIKEKPPEPKIEEKKQEIEEPEQEEPEPEPTNDPANDEPPPGDDLGLDADGSGGADGFGLKARKGGRSLIGGAHGNAALMRKYGWYTRIIQDELRKKINQYMDENGGIPDGDLNAVIQIKLDDTGKIVQFNISRSTGNQTMDIAVEQVLAIARISEPPPRHMPRTIKLKIAAKG
jgi:outer membrane biosynthesis protein TonB